MERLESWPGAKPRSTPSSEAVPRLRWASGSSRMVEETIAESGERWGMVSRIARQLGIGEQTLRNPVERAEIDTGRRPGTTTDEKASQDRRAGKGSPRAAAGQADPQGVGVIAFFRVYVKRTRPPQAVVGYRDAHREEFGSSRSAGSCSSLPPPSTPQNRGPWATGRLRRAPGRHINRIQRDNQ